MLLHLNIENGHAIEMGHYERKKSYTAASQARKELEALKADVIDAQGNLSCVVELFEKLEQVQAPGVPAEELLRLKIVLAKAYDRPRAYCALLQGFLTHYGIDWPTEAFKHTHWIGSGRHHHSAGQIIQMLERGGITDDKEIASRIFPKDYKKNVTVALKKVRDAKRNASKPDPDGPEVHRLVCLLLGVTDRPIDLMAELEQELHAEAAATDDSLKTTSMVDM